MKIMLQIAITVVLTQTSVAQLSVKRINATHRDGQTFVTWTDVAEGKLGMDYRYSLYCSDQPITELNLNP
jgi:hypothetical protein